MVLKPENRMPRILVVDDNAISGRHAVTVLRRHRGEVRRARSASEALKLSMEWLPHVICMDLHLPDSHGVAVIRQIREQWPAGRPGPRVLVITGDAGGLQPDLMAQLNVEQWLVKPVSGRQLAEFVAGKDGNETREGFVNGAEVELHVLFRKELQERLPELDHAISRFNSTGVANILHQLIASAAICREAQLESSLRLLDSQWRLNSASTEIARLYHSVLESSREVMSRESPP